MGNTFERVLAYLRSATAATQTPITNFCTRIANLLKNNFRGIFGFIAMLILFIHFERAVNHTKVRIMWSIMLVFFLLQPIPIPATSFIPIFILPLTGVMSSKDTCACYFSDNIVFLYLGGLMHLILNNSGYDRRFINMIVYNKSAKGYTAVRLMFKCSLASYLASIFSNRLLVTSYLMEMMATKMNDLQAATNKAKETDYGVYRDLLCMAIQVSSICGSLIFFHASYGLMIFKTMFECVNIKELDAFNVALSTERFSYAQFMALSVPISLVLFIANLLYFIILFKIFCKHDFSSWSQGQIHYKIESIKNSITPNITLHEWMTIGFYSLFVLLLFTRHSENLDLGWSILFGKPRGGIKDATVAAIFVVALSILPNGFKFTKILTAKKKSEIVMKPASGVMFWRFVNMYTNYGYLFLMGSGIALITSVYKSGLSKVIAEELANFVGTTNHKVLILLACLLMCVLCNIMPGVPAFIIVYPVVDVMIRLNDASNNDALRLHLFAMAMGFVCNFSFCVPFQNSPGRYCTVHGKMTVPRMVKYGTFAVVISTITVWSFTAYLGPYLYPLYEYTPPAPPEA